jgi:hypothetical protein
MSMSQREDDIAGVKELLDDAPNLYDEARIAFESMLERLEQYGDSTLSPRQRGWVNRVKGQNGQDEIPGESDNSPRAPAETRLTKGPIPRGKEVESAVKDKPVKPPARTAAPLPDDQLKAEVRSTSLSDSKPLRKRSELGKAKQQSLAMPSPAAIAVKEMEREADELFGSQSELPVPVATSVGSVAPGDENISAFVDALKKNGVTVSLLVAAHWGYAAREAVRRWLPTLDIDAMPECLAEHVKGSDKLSLKANPGDVELVQELRWASLKIEIADIAKWSDFQRTVVKAWIAQGYHREAMPSLLEPFYVEKGEKKALPAEDPRPAGPIDLGKALFPDPSPAPSENSEFERLVETILRSPDMAKEYDELEALLEVGDNRRDYATVNEALDKSERRALRAHALWAGAKLELKTLEIDLEEVNATLWKEASAVLEKEKEDGVRKKAITVDDVDGKIVELFRDEWRGGKFRLEKAKLTVERCERFSDLWSQKVRSLQVMLASVRK